MPSYTHQFSLVGGRPLTGGTVAPSLPIRTAPVCDCNTYTDTLLKIQATNVQESMTIDNTMTHCIPRKINKSYACNVDEA